MAIWYNWIPARKGQTSRAEAEIHINFWRLRSPWFWRARTHWFKREQTLLDIGIRFRHASSIQSFNLFLPFSAKPEDVVDLADALRDQRTLMAVFNEPYAAGPLSADHSFPVHDKGGRTVFICHTLRPRGDLTVTPRQYEDGPGATIAFSQDFCARFADDQEQYLRFRIKLNRAAAATLSFYQRRADRWFLTAVPRDEIIDFRINEQRSLPQEILDDMYLPETSELFKMTGVHYFLIRESDIQFVMAQSSFHKVRLLESQLWNRYLGESSQRDALRYRAFIYHWRKLAVTGDEVGDFNSLAKFRRIIAGWSMVVYILVVLGIGVGGNLVASKMYEKWFAATPPACSCPSGAAEKPPR